MSKYARLWVDILDDPKLMLAGKNGAKNLVFLPWLIAFAKRADASGRIEIDGKLADFRIIARSIPSATAKKIAKSLAELEAIHVLVRDPDGCYRFSAWDYRNEGKSSDSKQAVRDRVARHRARKRGHQPAEDVTPSNALQGVTPVTPNREKRVERREERGERREERDKAGSVEKGSLPPDAIAFGKKFYGAASAERRRDITRQLRATLNGGATLERGKKVIALSPERLAAKCREVIAEGVKRKDRAIVVLLKKLNDTTDVTEGAASASARAIARETAEGHDRLESALAWLKDNDDQQAAINRQLTATLPANVRESSSAFAVMARESAYHALVITAWSKAGEPTPSGATSP